MPRGSSMAAEVAVLVFESVRQVFEITGTITELPSQAQTVYSPGRCRSLTARTVDRLYLKVSVQRGFQL
jgi:hypothetical protein